MNPLLPPYVRGPSPFDSMDLSVQSTRSSSSPLSKAVGGAQQHSLLPHDYGHKQQQQQQPPLQSQHTHINQQHQQQQQSHSQQTQMHSANNYAIHLPASSPHAVGHPSSQQQQQQHQPPHRQGSQLQAHVANLNPHAIQQSNCAAATSSVAAAVAAAAAAASSASAHKYLSSNGGDCEMLPPPSSVGSAAGGSIASPNLGHPGSSGSSGTPVDASAQYTRESESYAKVSSINRNFENETKALHKPVELVSKDCNFSMSSNKVQQQVSPKKHSPLRNYHQPQQHYSHNGPHTPPMQSPDAKQQQPQQSSSPSRSEPCNLLPTAIKMEPVTEGGIMQDADNIMDYNQLHLQQNSSYGQHVATSHGLQPQVPTQNQTSPQHHQQQQQQELQQHSLFSARAQRQQQKQLAPPLHHQHQQQSPQLQQQKQHVYQHHQPSAPPSLISTHSHLANLEAFTSQNNSKMSELEHLTSAAPLHRPRTQPSALCFSTHNTSPDHNVTSNDDSVDSNSNSSRARRKRKPHKVARTPSNDSEFDDENAGSVCRAVAAAAAALADKAKSVEESREGGEGGHAPQCSTSNINTKPLLDMSRRSPRKAAMANPLEAPPRSSQLALLPSTSAALLEAALNAASMNRHLPTSAASSEDSENGKLTAENGCPSAVQAPQTPHRSDHDTDVETIDKIAEMIAKSGGGVVVAGAVSTEEVKNSNSSCNSRSLGGEVGGGGGDVEGSCLINMTSSPKTKKQRQALKLRNAEQHNSNSNCSVNSANTYNESPAADGVGAANDNAVLAEELRKENPSLSSAAKVSVVVPNRSAAAHIGVPEASAVTAAAPTTLKRPASPPNFTHSCSSSSSSSSSCSNSSRSSYVSKENKLKPAEEPSKPSKSVEETDEKDAKLVEQQKIKSNEEEQACRVDAAATTTAMASPKREVIKCDDGGIEAKSSLQEECKDDKKEVLKSPGKSCFEEVENKLEEMFAGIEDEPAPAASDESTLPVPSNVTEVANDLSLALELSTPAAANLQSNTTTSTTTKATPTPTTTTTSKLNNVEIPPPPAVSEKTPPTKAAKKSTVPSPTKSTAKNTTAPTRITPPRRRLSVLVEPTHAMESSRLNSACSEEKPTTSAAAAAATAAKARKESSSLPKKAHGGSRARNTQRGTATPKSKNVGGGSSGTGGSAARKLGAKGEAKRKKPQVAQQANKKQKGKQQGSDEEEVINARESNGAAGPAAIGEPKYKSPYILVKRDGSVGVINAPTAEDVGTEKQTKVKKTASHQRGYAQDRKNLRGMHSSTLSNKYDADTADRTWICVFCKRGPHRMGLGDLFGPYLVSTDCEEYRTATRVPGTVDLDAVMANKRRRLDMVQTHPRNLPVVPAVNSAWQVATTSKRLIGGGYNKKKKKSIDAPPPFTVAVDHLNVPIIDADAYELEQILSSGMCKASENTYEVWLHEDCAVWAPDLFLVGARVMGLDSAVWNSTRYDCAICGKSGAIVCCLQRECHAPAHLPCARESHWSLDEKSFQVFCSKHANNSNSSTNTPTTTATTAAAASATAAGTALVSSALVELLNRPPAKPTNSNLQSQRYS